MIRSVPPFDGKLARPTGNVHSVPQRFESEIAGPATVDGMDLAIDLDTPFKIYCSCLFCCFTVLR